MTLAQMSITGGLMITAIIVLRALFMNQLPKRTFVALWMAALTRLLIPFSIPFRLSIYTAASHIPQSAPVRAPAEPVRQLVQASMPAATQRPIAQPIASFAPIQAGTPVAAAATPPAPVAAPIDWLLILYIAGAALLAIYLLSAYIYLRREYRAAREVTGGFAFNWVAAQKLRRRMRVLASDRIQSPITYGLFRPCILLPESLLKDERQLPYVLTHELTHIRRLDAPLKLVFAAGLCAHWFNPLVWAMYILYNRDVELSCDEQVVRLLGADSRASYAELLLLMQTGRSRLTPLTNSFSRYCIKERIVAIMKYKKTSALALLLALTLVISVTVGFATSAESTKPTLTPLTQARTGQIYETTYQEPELEQIERLRAQTDLPYLTYLTDMDNFQQTVGAKYANVQYMLTYETNLELNPGETISYNKLDEAIKGPIQTYQQHMDDFIANLSADEVYDAARHMIRRDLLDKLRARRDLLTEALSTPELRLRAINFNAAILFSEEQPYAASYGSFYDNLESLPVQTPVEGEDIQIIGELGHYGYRIGWGLNSYGKGRILASDGQWYKNGYREPESGVSFRYNTERSLFQISPDNGKSWWTREVDAVGRPTSDLNGWSFFCEAYPNLTIQYVPRLLSWGPAGSNRWSGITSLSGNDYTDADGTSVSRSKASLSDFASDWRDEAFNLFAEAVRSGAIEGVALPPEDGYIEIEIGSVLDIPGRDDAVGWKIHELTSNTSDLMAFKAVPAALEGTGGEYIYALVTADASGSLDLKHVKFERIDLTPGPGEPPLDVEVLYMAVIGSEPTPVATPAPPDIPGMLMMDESVYQSANQFAVDEQEERAMRRALALMTEGYQDMTVGAFERAVLEATLADGAPSVYWSQTWSLLEPPLTEEESAFVAGPYTNARNNIWQNISVYEGRYPGNPPGFTGWGEPNAAMEQRGAELAEFIYWMGCEVLDPEGVTVGERERLITQYYDQMQDFIASMTAEQLFDQNPLIALHQERDRLTEAISTPALRLRAINFNVYYVLNERHYRTPLSFADNLEGEPPAQIPAGSDGVTLAREEPVTGLCFGADTSGEGRVSADRGATWYRNGYRDPATGLSFRYNPAKDLGELSPDNGQSWWPELYPWGFNSERYQTGLTPDAAWRRWSFEWLYERPVEPVSPPGPDEPPVDVEVVHMAGIGPEPTPVATSTDYEVGGSLRDDEGPKPYVLEVSIEEQRVYAYAPDANGEYTRLARTMKCSTGLAATPTITGTFQESTGPGGRWHYFKKFNCWAQYAYSIQGECLFHSVLYGTRDGSVTQSSVNNLGRRASHGSVRLSVEDAKWIWTNCPEQTKVVIY